MGADLLASFVTAGLKREIDFAAGKVSIEGLAYRALDEWPADILDYSGIDPEGYAKDSAAEADERDRLVEQLRADLSVLNDAVESYRRKVWTGEIGGKVVVLSEVSWGDAPTEAFEAIARLSAADITKAMGLD